MPTTTGTAVVNSEHALGSPTLRILGGKVMKWFPPTGKGETFAVRPRKQPLKTPGREVGKPTVRGSCDL
jgi:hypothetical protein